MTPIFPYSVWIHQDFGVVVVVKSRTLEDKMWEITLIERDGTVVLLESSEKDWIAKTRFVCELDEFDEQI